MLHVIMDQLENSAYNCIARYAAYMTIDTVAWLNVGAYTASNKMPCSSKVSGLMRLDSLYTNSGMHCEFLDVFVATCTHTNGDLA